MIPRVVLLLLLVRDDSHGRCNERALKMGPYVGMHAQTIPMHGSTADQISEGTNDPAVHDEYC